jgi:hypothetical protein
MKKFNVSFTYIEEDYHDIYEGEDEDDVEYQVTYGYEDNAFYDNHYVSNLEIEEIENEND